MTLIERIDELCQEKKVSRRTMEKESGLSTGSTSKWKSDYRPNQKSLDKISKYFGVSIAYLVGESEFKTEQDAMIHKMIEENDCEALADESRRFEAGCRIPVLGQVVAGIPIEMVEDILDWEEIPFRMTKTGTFFGLKIKGDSMSPRMLEGDTVIVKKQEDAESGDIVIATVNGNCATCKKLVKHNSGISLVSFNPNYPPMYFSNDEILQKPVTILGKVIENRQKY